MTNPSGKDQDIKAWNDGAFPASGGAVLPSFDDMCFLFTSYATTVAEWKDSYRGATYAIRLKAAIADMKFAISEAEKHPEISAPPQTASNEAMVALADETGWLIEKDDPPVYCVLSDDYDEHWASDANRALRFARREDAQAYSNHIGWTSPPVRIVEHMWPAYAASPATEVGVREALEFYADGKRYNGPNTRRTPAGAVRSEVGSESRVPKGMKPIYVKQWRTIVLVSEAYADKVRDALSRPPRPDATAGREEIARLIYATSGEMWKEAYRVADAILALSSHKQDKPETTEGSVVSSAQRGGEA